MPASFNGFHIHVANDKSCTIYMNLFGNLKFVHFRTFDTTILRQTNDGHKYANRTRHHNFRTKMKIKSCRGACAWSYISRTKLL